MLGKNILRTGRMIRGFTQIEVAEWYGVHLSTYQRWEHGKCSVSYDDVIAICEQVFMIPIDELQKLATYANKAPMQKCGQLGGVYA